MPRPVELLRLAPIALVILACTPGPRSSQRPATNRAAGDGAVTAPHGMVVSSSAIASAVGRDVLAAGGNAVDAAIATGLALAVTYPLAGNIGGGGFMVVRFPDGRATTIDFREKAPKAATAEMFLDSTGAFVEALQYGYRAVGVPGTVAGFALAHDKYGRTTWARLVDPAVRLADTGFMLPPGQARSFVDLAPRLSRWPASVAAFTKNGAPYAAGERLRQRDLARSLARIRDEGRDGFYRGETASLLVEDMRRHGGLITEEDLKAYTAKERPPVHGIYRGYEIISMGPPSSGGVALLEMLNILEGYDLAALRRDSPRYVHVVVEAMRRAFVDRARYLADPDFSSPPVARLTSKEYAASLRATIRDDRATPSAPAQVEGRAEGSETTHYSVVDRDGLAVAVTYTLGNAYGFGAVVPGAGFLLNHMLYDFNGKRGLTDTTGHIGTEPNLAAPAKRPLSNTTPTIVVKDGRLFAVTGSPGGRTMPNTVLEVVLNIIDGRMSMADAVHAPRLHHQWLPDEIVAERGRLPAATVAALERMGHRVRVGGFQGAAHSILIDPRTGARVGVPDDRRGNTSAGASDH